MLLVDLDQPLLVESQAFKAHCGAVFGHRDEQRGRLAGVLDADVPVAVYADQLVPVARCGLVAVARLDEKVGVFQAGGESGYNHHVADSRVGEGVFLRG